MEKIGNKIRILRSKQKITADQLAEQLGKKGENRKQYIYDIEAGRIKRIELDVLKTIADFFKVPITHFLTSNQSSEVNAQNEKITITDDEFTSENSATWKEKYYTALEENSMLKSLLLKKIQEEN